MTWLDSLVIGAFQVLGRISRRLTFGRGHRRRHAAQLRSSRGNALRLPHVCPSYAGGRRRTKSLGVLQRGALGSLLPVLPWGLLVAAVSGWFSIRWLIGFVSHHRLYAFAGYCLVLGVICLVLRSV